MKLRSAVGLHAHPTQTGDFVYVAPSVGKRLELASGNTVTLHVRGRSVRAQVAHPPPDRAVTGDAVHVSAPLLQRLRVPAPSSARFVRTRGNELHIGPIVGIFCQRYPFGGIYGPQTAFFRRLIQLGRRLNMIVYVFETGDVQRRHRTVNASTWVEGRGWVRRTFPLPHVIYDRGFVTGSVKRIQRWLRARGVQQFNSWVGGKLWVYERLAADAELARYIPETQVLRGTYDLVRMLARHGTVYVKSTGGGKGIGIWVLRVDSRGGYSYRYTDARCRIHGGRTFDLGGIVHYLRSRPRQPWFIQPRIDVLRSNGRIVDVRVLVQRDEKGSMHVTGTGARVGPPGSIISNLFGGGEAGRLEPIVQAGLGISASAAADMRRKIESIALRAADIIHEATRSSGHVGELGVDILIDKQGRLWFLEANSRTGRNVFQMAGMDEAAAQAMRRPLEFAAHLAGFGPADKAPTA